MTRIPNFKYHSIKPKRKGVPFFQPLLRSVGLKILTLPEKFGGIKLGDYSEQEQVLINVSRKVALSRVAVHVLPVLITICVFTFNWIEILNGPQINAVSTFFLQVGAKFHELTIAGSLAVIVLDVIRHELLHEGVNLGLVVSAFSVVGLNFLWSTEMLSIFKASYTWRKRLWLCSVIVVCCTLIGVVGPASAILLLPTQAWMSYGGTEFYLGASEEVLWPSRMTAQHIGPQTCRESSRATEILCPAGGYATLAARLEKPPEVAWEIYLQDARFTRKIGGQAPRFNYSWDKQHTQETWIQAPRGDVTFMLQDLQNVFYDAQAIATGRSRRLRDFVEGWYQISESKFPVGRTVCGPAQFTNPNTKTLPFPVLERDRKWRNISFGSNQIQGQLADHDVSSVLDFSLGAEHAKVQAKWIALGPEFGAATAGLAISVRNTTHNAARACTVDFRWATGQTYRHSVSTVWETHIGKPNTPTNSQNKYWGPKYKDFLDQDFLPFYSETIKADQYWLDNVFPAYVPSSHYDGLNVTTFEAMLENTLSGDLQMIMSARAEDAYVALATLEYVSASAFVDVLGRNNWYMSCKFPDNSMMINPALQNLVVDQRQIMSGGNIFRRPENINTTTLTVQWHTYGTAWTLQEPGQYIAIAILSIYVLIAVVHGTITLTRGTSMEAWDTISELLLLAWNSKPTRRDQEFNNASVGVRTLKTVAHKVKVVVVEDPSNGGSERVELVVVDEHAKNVDGRATHDIAPNEMCR